MNSVLPNITVAASALPIASAPPVAVKETGPSFSEVLQRTQEAPGQSEHRGLLLQPETPAGAESIKAAQRESSSTEHQSGKQKTQRKGEAATFTSQKKEAAAAVLEKPKIVPLVSVATPEKQVDIAAGEQSWGQSFDQPSGAKSGSEDGKINLTDTAIAANPGGQIATPAATPEPAKQVETKAEKKPEPISVPAQAAVGKEVEGAGKKDVTADPAAPTDIGPQLQQTLIAAVELGPTLEITPGPSPGSAAVKREDGEGKVVAKGGEKDPLKAEVQVRGHGAAETAKSVDGPSAVSKSAGNKTEGELDKGGNGASAKGAAPVQAGEGDRVVAAPRIEAGAVQPNGSPAHAGALAETGKPAMPGAVAGDPGTARPSAGAELDAQVRANQTSEANSNVETAKLVQKLNQSELKVNVQTAEFGRVDIRTTLSQHGFAANVYVERDGVLPVLAVELPSLNTRLSQHHGIQSSITLNQGPSSNAGFERQSQQQEQQARSETVSWDGSERSNETSAAAPLPVSKGLSTSLLDVHA